MWPPIALAGPTASGKTALALGLAQALAPQVAVEIISVDSALVYRGLDIATAKPTPAERAAVPHHLIDTHEPETPYSAAQFAADARLWVQQVQARGALPLLVGGTMLYFKALREGLSAMPAADPALRAELEAQAAALGWPALHAQLAQVDAASAARLAPHDSQRIQRALEVWRGTGRPLSEWQGHCAGAGLAMPLIALEPESRAWLHKRINTRFAQMLDQGLLAEVQRLRARPGMHAALPAARCVGVRQAWAALDAGTPEALAQLAETGAASTRQLAKRQLTWLRGMPDRQVLPCDQPDIARTLLDTVHQLLARA